jgi:hypothetical protein
MGKTCDNSMRKIQYTRKEVIVWFGIGVCAGMMAAAIISILCK